MSDAPAATAPRPGPRCRATTRRTAKSFDLREAFARDAGRVRALSARRRPQVFADLSKNLIDARTAGACCSTWRASAALEAAPRRDVCRRDDQPHRRPRGAAHLVAKSGSSPRRRAQAAPESIASELAEVHATLDAMLAYAEQVRADAAITDVVNIGIGGTDLGPADGGAGAGRISPAAASACTSSPTSTATNSPPCCAQLEPREHAVHDRQQDLHDHETMTNAASARAWFEAQGGTDIARHFAAPPPTSRRPQAFGISTTFGFWDWVGGRYSLWSAIGLPIAIAIGAPGLPRLAGRRARHGPALPHARRWRSNLPVRLGLLDVWYRNFHGFTSRSIAPYHQRLRRLPAYLQQLEMESNGKRVDLRRAGAALRAPPGAVGRARHQRPARLLPDAAPGHRRGAGRVRRRQESRATTCPATTPSCWPTCWRRPRR